jgi:2-polyprenyl-6-hydroxyphenyl methylase/3-demethylubiquinone-9 3-methyltransferase
MDATGHPSERFPFGDNWTLFAESVDDARIAIAADSLLDMLGPDAIAGRTFLDIGSGSGLFSLAASRLGASRIHSFDFDMRSVQCTAHLRDTYASSAAWTVEQGSVLESEYVCRLGAFDVVYAWGVLHHTGDMWSAIDRACAAVAPGGVLFIAIYNDQGLQSRIWRVIKRGYNLFPGPLRVPYVCAVMGPRELKALLLSILFLRPGDYVRGWRDYRSARGMSRWRDLVDWVGGYPFEVASPDAVFSHVKRQGFDLERLVTRQGLGCNEFVFRRSE